jgi:hypothetical protein
VAVTVAAEVPLPALIFAVAEPYEAFVPYWKTKVVAAPPGFTVPVSVTAFVVTVPVEPVLAVAAVAVETACCVRAPSVVEVVVAGVVLVAVVEVEPLVADVEVVAVVELDELEELVDGALDDVTELPVAPVAPDELELDAGQPSAMSAASCFCACATVVSSSASVSFADVSCEVADCRLDDACARCAVVPPASAVVSVLWSFASVAFALASVAFAVVALIRPITWPFFTFEPTETASEVSVPLVAKVGDSVSAVEMLPDAETLDATVPRATVTVRATPLEAADDVP